MAACGSSHSAGVGGPDAATGPHEAGGPMDALVSPVPEAQAGPLPPDVVVEQCDKMGLTVGTTTYFYAEHAYPGKSKADLARVGVVVHLPGGSPALGHGYEDVVGSPYVKDGFAAFTCAQGQSVTFVLPQ